MIKLNEKDIGKFVSFTFRNREYKKVLITKGETIEKLNRILLLNNEHCNANTHLDRSVYMYSIEAHDWDYINTNCSNIQYVEENLTGRYLKALVDKPQSISLLRKDEYVLILKNRELNLKNLNGTNFEFSEDDIYPKGAKYWGLMPIGFKPNKVVNKMQGIQEECKKRFPIECRFYPVGETRWGEQVPSAFMAR